METTVKVISEQKRARDSAGYRAKRFCSPSEWGWLQQHESWVFMARISINGVLRP